MKVKLWGVRGSLPAPKPPEVAKSRIKDVLKEFVGSPSYAKKDIEGFLKKLPIEKFGGFGGNTPCVEVTTSTTQVIIDGGTGIRRLGQSMMAGPCANGAGELHVLFTHFHWDHLIGLPFFGPLFVKGNKIHVYAVQPDVERAFRTLFQKPFFPVPYENLGAQIIYHQLEPRAPFKIGDIQITPYALDHPDPCWGYKMENGGRVFSHCVDTEGIRVTRKDMGPDLPLYQGVDLLIFDAQYTLAEAIEKINWGHSAALVGIEIALRESIKKLIFYHHDPSASDEKVADAATQTREYYDQRRKVAEMNNESLPQVDWSFAEEETVMTV